MIFLELTSSNASRRFFKSSPVEMALRFFQSSTVEIALIFFQSSTVEMAHKDFFRAYPYIWLLKIFSKLPFKTGSIRDFLSQLGNISDSKDFFFKDKCN